MRLLVGKGRGGSFLLPPQLKSPGLGSLESARRCLVMPLVINLENRVIIFGRLLLRPCMEMAEMITFLVYTDSDH